MASAREAELLATFAARMTSCAVLFQSVMVSALALQAAQPTKRPSAKADGFMMLASDRCVRGRLAPFGLEVQALRRPALKSRAAPAISAGMKARDAKFALGQVVKHRVFPFRGVIFDVDPEFSNTEEWWQAIPAEIRPRKDQPFYHLLAENAESEYIAYVSEQNLLPDTSGEPLRHPQIADVFDRDDRGGYRMRMQAAN